MGYVPITRCPGTLHKKIVLEWSIRERLEFVMRRRTAPSPISSASVVTFWGSAEIGGDGGILTFATCRGVMGFITIYIAEGQPESTAL